MWLIAPLTTRTPIRWPAALVVWFLSAACATWVPSSAAPGDPTPPSTLDKLVEQAEAGDAASRNLVGYLLFTGQSAHLDPQAAVGSFRAAADQGHMVAQLNLAILNYFGAGLPPDQAEAERLFELASANPDRPLGLSLTSLEALVDKSCDRGVPRADPGRNGFGRYCSGCHGSNGIAEYGLAPSFAFGERMEKSKAELLHTVLNGHGSMPNWSDKLPQDLLERALSYARSLEGQFRWGIVHVVDEPSEYYFSFGDMSTDFGNRPQDDSRSYKDDAPTLEDYCSGA